MLKPSRWGGQNPRDRTEANFRGTWLLSAAAVGLILLAAPVAAEEPADAFIKGLHARGLDELTLDYLDRMQTSPLASADFRRRIPFHRGTALLELSRQAADPVLRGQRLAEARTELDQFAAANPASVEAAEGQIQIGGLLVELGRQTAAQVTRLPNGEAYSAQREKIFTEARRYLADAGAIFERVATSYAAKL
jgi:hypothetical protein